MVPFEDENVEAYRLLLRVEVTLRELVRAKMSARFGPAWHKRLPGDLLRKIREAQRDEESRRPFGFLALGPLYYLTFGELLEVLRHRDADEAIVALGGQGMVRSLETLTSPRNAVGHARSVSTAGLLTIRAIHQQMETALTPSGMTSLLSNPDCGLYPSEARECLRDWLQSCLRVVEDLEKPIPDSGPYRRASEQYWWSADKSAPFDCHAISRANDLLLRYEAVPGGLGSKAERLRFAEEYKLRAAVIAALDALKGGV